MAATLVELGERLDDAVAALERIADLLERLVELIATEADRAREQRP